MTVSARHPIEPGPCLVRGARTAWAPALCGVLATSVRSSAAAPRTCLASLRGAVLYFATRLHSLALRDQQDGSSVKEGAVLLHVVLGSRQRARAEVESASLVDNLSLGSLVACQRARDLQKDRSASKCTMVGTPPSVRLREDGGSSRRVGETHECHPQATFQTCVQIIFFASS